jgi:alpha-1,2-mannosyltransferase
MQWTIPEISDVDPETGGPRRPPILLSDDSAWLLLALGALAAVVGLGLYLVLLATHSYHSVLDGFDFKVYLEGGSLALHDPAALYTWHLAGRPGIQFTYTPFAALTFSPLTAMQWHRTVDILTVLSLIALAGSVWIAFRECGWRGLARAGGTLAVTGVAIWFQPTQKALALGQIELVMMGAIVWDLCQPSRRRWKGAVTGVAAGIKLVPLLYVLYLILTKRYRQAAVAGGAFAATVAIGFAVLPADSVHFWLDGYFFNASRTGFVGANVNQSLRSILTRLDGSVAGAAPIWLVAALIAVVLGLATAVLLDRAGQTFAGLMTCALTALLVSPISWDHHWVWMAPGLVVLIDAAVRHRRWRWLFGSAAAGVVVAFLAWPQFWKSPIHWLGGGLFTYAPGTYFPYGDNPKYIEYHWYGIELILGNLYVLAGCALLLLAAATAYWLVRHQRPVPKAGTAVETPG